MEYAGLPDVGFEGLVGFRVPPRIGAPALPPPPPQEASTRRTSTPKKSLKELIIFGILNPN
jgi:hypothetical protein